MKEWLQTGCIPKDNELEIDLTGPEFHYTKLEEFILESKEDMKERGLDSPDFGDALALTFTYPVKIKNMPANPMGKYGKKSSWLHTDLGGSSGSGHGFMG
jgi:hypothetical protein